MAGYEIALFLSISWHSTNIMVYMLSMLPDRNLSASERCRDRSQSIVCMKQTPPNAIICALSAHIKFQWQNVRTEIRTTNAHRQKSAGESVISFSLFIEIQFVYNLFSLIFGNLFWLPSVFFWLVLLWKCLLPSEIIALVLSFAHSCSLYLSLSSASSSLHFEATFGVCLCVHMSFAVPF